MKRLLLLLLVLNSSASADDFASRCADRAAIERVYYQHRLGEKPPFEQVLPPATLENLVRQDVRKETALKQAYGVEVTPALLEAEVQRINNNTRAPEMLAELKAALGNDPARFARALAKPILVERLLREKFDNDDALHSSQRRQIEQIRSELFAARSSRGNEAHSSESEIDQGLLTSVATNGVVEKLAAILKQRHPGSFSETTWQLTPRPAETNAPSADELEIKKQFGPKAQLLGSLERDAARKFYFDDLPPQLQRVLRTQLRQPGDVSAVIETPGGFLLYLAKQKTPEALRVAAVSLPKRSYEQWLDEEPSPKREPVVRGHGDFRED